MTKLIITTLLLSSVLFANSTLEEAYTKPYIFENVQTYVKIGDKELNLKSEIMDTGIQETTVFKKVIPFIQQGSIKIFQKDKEVLSLSYEKYYDKNLNLIRSQSMTSKKDIITCKIVSDKNELPSVITPGFISEMNVMECDNNTEEKSIIIFKNSNEIIFYSKTSLKNQDNEKEEVLEERIRTLLLKNGILVNVKEEIISNNIYIRINSSKKD